MVTLFVVLDIFILFVTISDISSEAADPEVDMSEISKKVHNAIRDDFAKKLFLSQYRERKRWKIEKENLTNEICELKMNQTQMKFQQKFREFLCAIVSLKRQFDKLHPQFKGGWIHIVEKHKYTHCGEPQNFTSMLSRFKQLEKKYNIEKKTSARVRIPKIFKHMCTLLTRYDDRNYEQYLTTKCSNKAKNIMNLLIAQNLNYSIRPEYPEAFDEFVIITSFSKKYAFLRHSFNLFLHHENQLAIEEMIAILGKNETNRPPVELKNQTAVELPPASAHLCDLLHQLGILQMWMFTDEDLTIMNTVSRVIHPHKTAIYYPHNCYIKNKHGKQTRTIIPLTRLTNCPIKTDN